MPRILTVDDSRAIRNIVGKSVQELGFELDEAEDGEQGLVKLEGSKFDLVLLDVTMPVLDGPGMLAKLRERGDKTPVLMLTSESKRSIVAGVMKLGIEDYILKPFKPEELKAKVMKALKQGPAAAPEPTVLAAIPTPEGSDTRASKQFIDILVVDDMENVQKKLRGLLPPHVTLNGAISAQAALTLCRERIYRVILIDIDIPDVNSSVLMNQLRTLQGHAAFLALSLQTSNDAGKEAKQNGFDDVFYKPFSRDGIEDFLLRYFDDQELVVSEDNLVRICAFKGKEDRLEKYYSRATQLVQKLIENIAAACFDEAIIDLAAVPLRPDRTPRFVMDVQNDARKVGLDVKLVATPDGCKLLHNFTETAKVAVWSSVAEAKAAEN
jgi:two-component system cell cycle response regulator